VSAKPPSDVPEGVHQLLRERVGGFEELELLLRLARDPARAWTLEEAEAALGMNSDALAAAFQALADKAVIAALGQDRRMFRFQPESADVRAACEALIRLYDQDRFGVVVLLGQIAFERINRVTARAFADAFVIRKARKGGTGGDDA